MVANEIFLTRNFTFENLKVEDLHLNFNPMFYKNNT